MRRILIFTVMLVACMAGYAQHLDGLGPISEIFGDKSPILAKATVAVVSGRTEKSLADNKLDYFKSVSVSDSASMSKMNSVAMKLLEKSVDNELSSSLGVINYAFYSFPPSGSRNRYMFIFSNGKKTVAMYMEGDATFSDIKKMIKK